MSPRAQAQAHGAQAQAHGNVLVSFVSRLSRDHWIGLICVVLTLLSFSMSWTHCVQVLGSEGGNQAEWKAQIIASLPEVTLLAVSLKLMGNARSVTAWIAFMVAFGFTILANLCTAGGSVAVWSIPMWKVLGAIGPAIFTIVGLMMLGHFGGSKKSNSPAVVQATAPAKKRAVLSQVPTDRRPEVPRPVAAAAQPEPPGRITERLSEPLIPAQAQGSGSRLTGSGSRAQAQAHEAQAGLSEGSLSPDGRLKVSAQEIVSHYVSQAHTGLNAPAVSLILTRYDVSPATAKRVRKALVEADSGPVPAGGETG